MYLLKSIFLSLAVGLWSCAESSFDNGGQNTRSDKRVQKDGSQDLIDDVSEIEDDQSDPVYGENRRIETASANAIDIDDPDQPIDVITNDDEPVSVPAQVGGAFLTCTQVRTTKVFKCLLAQKDEPNKPLDLSEYEINRVDALESGQDLEVKYNARQEKGGTYIYVDLTDHADTDAIKLTIMDKNDTSYSYETIIDIPVDGPIKINKAQLTEDDETINNCLEQWGDHPFTQEQVNNYNKLVGTVEVFGIGPAIDDKVQTATPKLMLVKPPVNVFSTQTFVLGNPNGYYCLNRGFNLLSRSTVEVHCDAKMIANGGKDILSGGNATDTSSVSVFSNVDVVRKCAL